jgi:hypothetical protein
MKLMLVVSKTDLKEVMRYNDLTVSMANDIHLLDIPATQDVNKR